MPASMRAALCVAGITRSKINTDMAARPRRWLPPEVFVLTCAFDTLERERAAAERAEPAGPAAGDHAHDARQPGPRDWLRRALRFHGLCWGK